MGFASSRRRGRRVFSRTLLRIESSEIGRLLSGVCCGLPGLGIRVTIACFRGVGKWWCWSIALPMFVIMVCSRGGASFRSSAVIWSFPGDFLFGNFCIMVLSSFSVIFAFKGGGVVFGMVLNVCSRSNWVIWSVRIFGENFVSRYWPSASACSVSVMCVPLYCNGVEGGGRGFLMVFRIRNMLRWSASVSVLCHCIFRWSVISCAIRRFRSCMRCLSPVRRVR